MLSTQYHPVDNSITYRTDMAPANVKISDRGRQIRLTCLLLIFHFANSGKVIWFLGLFLLLLSGEVAGTLCLRVIEVHLPTRSCASKHRTHTAHTEPKLQRYDNCFGKKRQKYFDIFLKSVFNRTYRKITAVKNNNWSIG